MISETKARAWEESSELLDSWVNSGVHEIDDVLAHVRDVVIPSLRRRAAIIRARAKTTHAAKREKR